MNILIIGGRGFLGRKLTEKLSLEYNITLTSRSAKPQQGEASSISLARWDTHSVESLIPLLEKSDAIINLAGEPLGARRWTVAHKEQIFHSRVGTTRALLEALALAHPKPHILLNASAVGYYGNATEEVTEHHTQGSGFLANLCEQWEKEAERAMTLGIRVVLLRTGIVLSRDGGIFPKFVIPTRFFSVPVFGRGTQWFPWIHVEDELRAIEFLLTAPISGAVNLTAPFPVQMKDFCHQLATHLHRPFCWHVPETVVRLVFGEMGTELLLQGQRALPKKLLEGGFQFHYPTLESSLTTLL